MVLLISSESSSTIEPSPLEITLSSTVPTKSGYIFKFWGHVVQGSVLEQYVIKWNPGDVLSESFGANDYKSFPYSKYIHGWFEEVAS